LFELLTTITKHAINQEIDNEQAELVHKCFAMALWSDVTISALKKFVDENFDDMMK